MLVGGASGIDSYAHAGTFNVGKTIMYVAGGFSKILRGQKYSLAKKILENDGAIISEYADDVVPQDFTFLARNRLIATHSEATIVIEAPIKSGALNTASFARKYGKKVFSVPWTINYSNGQGNLSLFDLGARPIISYKDVFKYLNTISNYSIFEEATKENAMPKHVPEQYKKYFDFIKINSPVYIGCIYSFFESVSVSEINSILSLLEMDDLVYSINDEYFIKWKSTRKNPCTFSFNLKLLSLVYLHFFNDLSLVSIGFNYIQ